MSSPVDGPQRGHFASEVHSALMMHMDVCRATVTERSGSHGETRLVVSVVPAERIARRIQSSSRERRLAEWRDVYGAVYERRQHSGAFGDDFGVWSSSYDRQPIERAEMEEWRTATVDTLMSLRPRRVLEIGAGSGLILSRVAPACEQYWATDLSGEAVELLSRAVVEEPSLRDVIELRQQPAHVFDGLPTDWFDLVVVNSVVQYFPDIGYLSDVLRGAVAALTPGGAVLLGDIRNRRLRRSLYAAAELRSAGEEADAEQVRNAVEHRMRQENELFLDPEYFCGLAESLSGVSALDVRLRRGTHHNELTRHRYDVLLYTDPVAPLPLESAARLRWGTDIGDADSLERLLSSSSPTAMILRGVPNRRLLAETGALDSLEQRQLRTAITKISQEDSLQEDGLDPEECHLLGERTGYDVRTTWSAGARNGEFDVAFLRRSAISTDERFVLAPEAHDDLIDGEWQPEALDGPQAAAFVASLASYLEKVFTDPSFPEVDFVLTE